MLPLSALAPISILPQYYNNEFYFFVATLKTLQNNITTNFLASPLSVETFIKLFQLLCSEECSEEIREGLFHLELHREKIKSDVQDLMHALNTECRNLKLVSFMFLHKDYEVHEDLSLTFDGFFRANAERCDFAQPETAAESINRIIASVSQNSITRAVDSQMFSENTKSILLSTVYFQGQWYQPFEDTMKSKFFKTKDQSMMVDMLHGVGLRKFYRSEELKADLVEVRFVEDGGMVIVVPDEIKGLSVLQEKMKKVFDIRSFHFEDRFVKVVFPVFKICTQIDFTSVLQECGIKKIFNPEEADFARLIGHDTDFYINSVFQKVRLEVTKTGVSTNNNAVAPNEQFRREATINNRLYRLVNANHPFFFYIRIKDAIIFVGRVLDPTSEEFAQ